MSRNHKTKNSLQFSGTGNKISKGLNGNSSILKLSEANDIKIKSELAARYGK